MVIKKADTVVTFEYNALQTPEFGELRGGSIIRALIYVYM